MSKRKKSFRFSSQTTWLPYDFNYVIYEKKSQIKIIRCIILFHHSATKFVLEILLNLRTVLNKFLSLFQIMIFKCFTLKIMHMNKTAFLLCVQLKNSKFLNKNSRLVSKIAYSWYFTAVNNIFNIQNKFFKS